MKKIVLFFLFLAGAMASQAQTPTQVVTFPGVNYVYLGSLTQSVGSTYNSQKIIVKILGGSWFGDSNGETAFYISNRNGLTINETSLGSNMTSRVTLKVYQNGANIDFYLMPSLDDYTSFAVNSYSFGYQLTPQFVNIVVQQAVPNGTDITSSVIINPTIMTDGGGNIGIGTTTPNGYKLAVNGGVHAKSVKVDTDNWPDYVFHKDHVLMPLTEVKTYIDENHHLPEIPSAKEVTEKGLDLGEMNKLLTKKVEELTLYLIEVKSEKDKEKRDQEDRINRLEEQLKKITR
ncbi:hypothetical protein [Pedobacter cryoconitis]|uniref:Uncharacterized protein n=1 Tax=Pedobacter cryoconitis TaxID=188932 RepID=A0A7X0MMN4_9SPHI|nr:hypothetical protein [Pedobacter cryoconitis]MBB6502653.1 hypothetical protein [Pedobacter cryoconitis]